MSAPSDQSDDAGQPPAGPQRTREVLNPFIANRVRRLHSLIQAHWVSWYAVRAPGLTPAQGGALMVIAENPGITQGELAALLYIEAPSVSQMLTPLIGRKLVERRSGTADRRVAEFSLTASGQTLSDAIRTDGRANEERLLDPLTPTEREQFLALFDRVLVAGGEPGSLGDGGCR